MLRWANCERIHGCDSGSSEEVRLLTPLENHVIERVVVSLLSISRDTRTVARSKISLAWLNLSNIFQYYPVEILTALPLL